MRAMAQRQQLFQHDCHLDAVGRGQGVKTRSGWTPFDGFEAQGWPIATIIRGQIIMRDDEVIAPSQGAPVRFNETLGEA